MNFKIREKVFFLLVSIIIFFSIVGFSYEDELSVSETKGRLESSRLDFLGEKYIAAILRYDPERATEMGVHDNDYLLTDREYQTQILEIESLRMLRKELERINRDVLDYQKKTEYDIIHSMIEKDLYELENLNVLSLRPDYYLKPFDVIYFMMNKDFENYNIRASNALKRLKQIPSILYQAERNLTTPPKIWTEYTIKRIELLEQNIGEYYPLFRNYIGLDPTLRSSFDSTIDEIKNALTRYKNYLKITVLKKSTGKAYCGLYTYGFYLERWHKIDYNPRKVLRLAKKNFEKNYKNLIKEAIKINPEVYTKDGIKGVYSLVTGDFPKYDEVIKFISDEINNAKNYFDEYKIVLFPTQRLLIKNIPLFMYGVYPTIFYYPPYPLDRERSSELYIYLPSEKDPNVNFILQSVYSQPKIEFFMSGLVMPGLHLKSDASKNLSRIRKISNQPSFDYGWMNYSEDLAYEMGYFSTIYSSFLLSYMKTLRALRAYMDVAFHIEELDFQQCISYFKDILGFSDEMAKTEMINISLNPTYYYAQVYGYENFIDLRKKYVSSENKFFDMREFHSDILSRGSIPIKNLKEELKEIRKIKLKEKLMQEVEEENE